MSRLAEVEQFIRLSQHAESLSDLANLMEGVTSAMGFNGYALIRYDTIPVSITNAPAGWVDQYITQNLDKIDPTVVTCRTRNTGFAWWDVTREPHHRDFFDTASRAGVGEGFKIPYHVPGQPLGACDFGMRAGVALPVSNLPMAQSVGLFAFEAARRLGSPAPAAPVTERQLQCVALAGRGLTETEIGKQLGISDETVKRHLKEARTSLGVSKTIQAVVRLLYDGQIGLQDLR